MALSDLYARHGRSFEANRFVYPVLSRRSRGLSVGVNLNPDKVCNFDCVYCQVDRTKAAAERFVEMQRLVAELGGTLDLVRSGEIYEHCDFAAVPAELRRLNDIAFSGDGEPTTYRNFDEIVAACAEVKRQRGLDAVKMVLITNASMFHREPVRRGLDQLMANQGEIWAKLDAGTADYFREVDRTSIPFARILENLGWAAGRWPLVIQSLFMRIRGQGPAAAELDAYCQRLDSLVQAGGRILRVQVYTIARTPAESWVAALADDELEGIARLVRIQTGLGVEAFPGAGGS